MSRFARRGTHERQSELVRLPPLLGLLVLAGCLENEEGARAPGPRPVTVIELRETDPVGPLQLTGSVKSWKEEDVAFEVEGRVEWVVEEGTNLEGRWVENSEARVEGSVLARLDPRSYLIARDTAAAALEVAKQELNTAIVELEKSLPANVKATAAERDRAQAEYVRYKQAAETNAVAQVDVLRATADRDAKAAGYERALAGIEIKKAEIESLKAGVRQSGESLKQASYDLERCTLYAPFSGEVSAVVLEAGGHAKAGESVVHLVMMDPMTVEVAVSEKTARRLEIRDAVNLFLPGEKKPVFGSIYKKATVADPETRTFRVSILVRNRRTFGEFSLEDPLLEKSPIVSDFMYLTRSRVNDKRSSLYVEENRSLEEDDDGHFVWAAADHKIGSRVDPKRPLVTLRKFRVTPGEHRTTLQGLYIMRELEDAGDLEEGTPIAMNVPDGVADGDEVLLLRHRWLLHPGQLIPVILGASVPMPGLYLPMRSIQAIDQGRGHVFVAVEGRARKVEVEIMDHVGQLFRIQGAKPGNADLITAGTSVITNHVHFLRDGEKVQVIKTVELRP